MTVTLETRADLVVDAGSLSAGDRVAHGTLRLSNGKDVRIGDQLLDAINYLLVGMEPGVIGHVEVDEVLLSPQRAADILGVTRPTIYAWQDRGLIRREDTKSGQRSVPWSAVEEFQEQRKQRAEARRDLAKTLATPVDDAAVSRTTEAVTGAFTRSGGRTRKPHPARTR